MFHYFYWKQMRLNVCRKRERESLVDWREIIVRSVQSTINMIEGDVGQCDIL